MGRQKFPKMLHQRGRPRTAAAQTWNKLDYVNDEFHPKSLYPYGVLMDVSPMPGNTYTRATWPPRGRGRGEALDSPRRIQAKIRTAEVIRLYSQGYTFREIAQQTGFKDPSGPYRALKRTMDRMNWDRDQKARNRAYL